MRNQKYSQRDQIPGAESATDVTARAEKLLAMIENEYSGRRVLSISHGALIRFVLQVVTSGQIPPKGERLENASLNVVRKMQVWKLDTWAPKPLGG